MPTDNVEKEVRNLAKGQFYSTKLIPKVLLFFKKIDKYSDYEDWLKEQKPLLLEFLIITLLFRPLVLFACLSAGMYFFEIIFPVVSKIFLAEGISLFWYLIISFKEEWRQR